jgi:hypothetical protein
VVNALTGAAIGAGTKLIIDKITGKPVIKSGTGTTVPKAPITGTPKAPITGTPKAPVTGTPKSPAGGTKTPPAGGTKTPPAGGTKTPPTSVVKPPAGGGSLITADEAYKGTLADESLGLPEGSIDNGDGTYTSDGTTFDMQTGMPLYRENAEGGVDVVTDNNDGTYTIGNTTYSMDNDSVLYTTDADGNITVAGSDSGGGGETNVVGEGDDGSSEEQYYEDDSGNIYTMNDDGSYDLYRAAEVDEDISAEDAGLFGTSPVEEEEQYYEDDSGNTYILNDDGEYDLYRAAEVPEDIVEEDYGLFDTYPEEEFVYEPDERYSTFEDDGDEYYDFKSGGLTTMMKNGGVPRFEDGGVAYMPYGAVDNNDGTFTIDNDVFDMETGDPLYSMNDDGEIIYVEPSAISGYVDNEDGTYTMDGITYDIETDMPLYADSESGVDIATDNGDGTYTIGNQTYDMETNEPLYTTNPTTRSLTVNPTAISNVGSGATNTKKDVYQTDAEGNVFKNGVFYRAPDIPNAPTSFLDSDFLSTLTNALGTTAGAAGAGALVASLLGSDFTGGGSGAQNQGVDMSQVGLINPRTTDFGIGPTNFVGYDQYGTDADDYTPNEELLRNLNAPGYNPVREGDYGYEEVPAEEEEVPEMASGGLSSMSTPVASYYTFGQPADILANLGMRPQPPMNPPEMMPQVGQQKPAQQMQQQGLPQQMPPQMAQQAPQGMPQQGMMPQQQGMPPPMRKGGLPHVSNVPLTQGRMDFRKGAAVHGAGDGQSDDIPAMLADGEYVIDAETVAQIGNGSTKAGAQALDKFREGIRAHKRSAPVNKIPPKTKALTSYLKGAR